MKKYLVILLAAMMIVACKKEKTAPTLSLSPTDLEFSSKGGSKTVKVQTNTDWTLTPDGADWYTVSPTQGSGVTDVTVTLNEYTDASPRTARIKFKAEGLVETLAIVQTRRLRRILPN